MSKYFVEKSYRLLADYSMEGVCGNGSVENDWQISRLWRKDMDIQNISIYGGSIGKKEASSSNTSFLGIGKKGQIVQGKITKVANNISINFNGIEVNVSKGAVRGAKEGEVRNFQITDVSKDSIVLKEVEKEEGMESVRGRVSTSVAPSNYSFAECLEASADTVQAKEQASESLSILNGEDYESIEEQEGSVSKVTKECVERAVERIKAKKQWNEERQQEASELREELQEGLEKLQATGFLSQKSEARIESMLREAGIPVTSDTLAKVVTALGMSQAALDITDQSKSYIIGQDLSPTIENLYQGKYSAADRGSADNSSQSFEDYQKQIEGILAECGRDDETGMENAKWLFSQELPINESTLSKLEQLNQISGEMAPDKVLEQIIFAMTAGASPKDAVLDDREFVIARDALQDFQNIDDSTIYHAADLIAAAQKELTKEGVAGEDTDNSGKGQIVVNLAFLRQVQKEKAVFADSSEKAAIPVTYTADMTQEEILQVSVKRQLEEIRQKMTLQSAVAMEKKGIHIETESLEKIIRSLREMENAYYSSQVREGTAPLEEEHLDLLQETLGKTMDIANSHAALLGSGVRKQALLTVNELHAAASSQTANRSEWNGVFETVSTQVRGDLGDSIQKAFEGIPAILEEMGLEDTQANERAVRILGYNSMELTRENIEQVKVFDAKVNRVIDNMKPATVLELIRRGDNPLDMPLDELNQELQEIQKEKGISTEERYSRFLWQMEKSGEITKEERKGYIGVYRLLNQIQKTDGAVVGAVLEAGQELTLGNLLTQARTRKGKGVDSVVDDTTGMNQGRQVRNSITDQINAGFSKRGTLQQSGDSMQEEGSFREQQKDYYQHLAQEALSEVTPSGIQEMADGDMERMLAVSLEKFCEDLKKKPGNTEIKKQYFEEQAQQIRETLASGEEAQEYLEKLMVSPTIENLLAAASLIKEDFSPYKESYGRKNVLSKERREEFDEVVDSIEESIDKQEDLTEKCAKAEKIMSEILTKSYEQADISFEDLSRLQKLSRGIHLEGALRRSQSYDIPIRTGDTITSLNLTLVHGSEESGKIQISMEDETFGHISMDVRVKENQLKGLVLCDQRQGFEALKAQRKAMEADLEYAGYQIKNISYGMDFKERNELLQEQVQNSGQNTAQLYRIAKILVRSVAAVVRTE